MDFENSLGAFNGYIDSYDNVAHDFASIISKGKSAKEIDVSSLIQLVSRYHFFGDRTLIADIKKTPWMAKQLNEDKWSFYDLPPHAYKKDSTESIASTLESLVRDEIRRYVGEKQNIGILLSGGMDSRIVAGILKSIQKNELPKLSITAITWGVKNSRDVVYANVLADYFKWDWKHFELSPEVLEEAIQVSGKNGAEYSPIHLHAMHRVAKVQGIDMILGGSYGDSIGRAEYSGKHLTKIQSIDKYFLNWFGIFNHRVYCEFEKKRSEDIQLYRNLFPRNEEYQYREIERQCHYMRRMLNPCMKIINDRIPLKQVFTSPEVFGYMWSLDPQIRTDEVYHRLLRSVDPKLLEISWARTGKAYFSEKGDTDNYSKQNNAYGAWIRNDLSKRVEISISGDVLQSLNVFNFDAIKRLFKASKRHYKLSKASKIDEILLWLCSLEHAVEEYSLSSKLGRKAVHPFDSVRKHTVWIESWMYSKIYSRRNK